jgi:hypothetical protein
MTSAEEKIYINRLLAGFNGESIIDKYAGKYGIMFYIQKDKDFFRFEELQIVLYTLKPNKYDPDHPLIKRLTHLSEDSKIDKEILFRRFIISDKLGLKFVNDAKVNIIDVLLDISDQIIKYIPDRMVQKVTDDVKGENKKMIIEHIGDVTNICYSRNITNDLGLWSLILSDYVIFCSTTNSRGVINIYHDVTVNKKLLFVIPYNKSKINGLVEIYHQGHLQFPDDDIPGIKEPLRSIIRSYNYLLENPKQLVDERCVSNEISGDFNVTVAYVIGDYVMPMDFYNQCLTKVAGLVLKDIFNLGGDQPLTKLIVSYLVEKITV